MGAFPLGGFRLSVMSEEGWWKSTEPKNGPQGTPYASVGETLDMFQTDCTRKSTRAFLKESLTDSFCVWEFQIIVGKDRMQVFTF